MLILQNLFSLRYLPLLLLHDYGNSAEQNDVKLRNSTPTSIYIFIFLSDKILKGFSLSLSLLALFYGFIGPNMRISRVIFASLLLAISFAQPIDTSNSNIHLEKGCQVPILWIQGRTSMSSVEGVREVAIISPAGRLKGSWPKQTSRPRCQTNVF